MPLEEAVILATPSEPGLHCTGVMVESQLPAQARPLLAMVRTVGLSDWYVTGAATAVPLPLVAVAVNCRVLPMSIDPLVGESRIEETRGGPGGVFLLPQAASAAITEIMEMRKKVFLSLPINPEILPVTCPQRGVSKCLSSGKRSV